MDDHEIAALRLRNQALTGPRFAQPGEAVAWLGAMQSQEAAVARWSIGSRCTATTDTAVLQALADGTVLRTHLLRPTWHFVANADLRWITELTRPKVLALNAYQDRKLGIDEAQFTRSQHAIAAALGSGTHLTRDELSGHLAAAGLAVTGPRLSHFLMRAELSLLICSGAPRDGTHTYALVDERVPAAPAKSRDEALAALASRFFHSHGPATLKDFMVWASLGARDAQRGVDGTAADLLQFTATGTAWITGRTPRARGADDAAHSAHWLQGYDEYLVGHSDSRRIAVGDTPHTGTTPPGEFVHVMIADGRVAGRWRRDGPAAICLRLRRPLQRHEQHALWQDTQRLSEFLGKPVPVRLVDGLNAP